MRVRLGRIMRSPLAQVARRRHCLGPTIAACDPADAAAPCHVIAPKPADDAAAYAKTPPQATPTPGAVDPDRAVALPAEQDENAHAVAFGRMMDAGDCDAARDSVLEGGNLGAAARAVALCKPK